MKQDRSIATVVAETIGQLSDPQPVQHELSEPLTRREAEAVQALRGLLRSLAGMQETEIEDSGDVATRDVVMLQDGRYAAANAQYQADLRIDTQQTRIVSMDIFTAGTSSRRYLASVRSHPGKRIRAGQHRFGVVGEDENGNSATGVMEITPVSETQATISLVLANGLESLPVNVPCVLSATWQSASFRTIGLEVDQETGVAALPSVQHDGRTVTIQSCFADAGIEVVAVGDRDAIPRPGQGWDDAQLHGLMVRLADESLSQRAWILHLLVLSRSTLDGLLGVMFDSGEMDANGLPRQGAAVFSTPIQSHPGGAGRKMIQTVVHELGHALNLAHRFERAVSRADSNSFMNYDWRYLGGGREDLFWDRFRYFFDPDEIRLLRHAPWPALIPGGAEFHTINYWSDGTGGYSPYVPEVPLQGLELQIHLPETGALFQFSQPVLLTIELRNTSGQPLNIPRQLLDPKSGFVEIMVRRLGPRRRRLSEDIMPFMPILTRCWDAKQAVADTVPNGGSMSNNLNLTFGSAGFTFAEPGSYEITAVLAVFDRVRQVDQIVRSNPVQIRIAYPRSLEEERDAVRIMQKDVGYYLALGGSDVLSKAADTLAEISEKRQGKAKAITDPLVAHVMRCQAINLTREFVTYDKGKYKARAAQPDKAASLLSKLEAQAGRCFDPMTQRGNRTLLDRLKARKK